MKAHWLVSGILSAACVVFLSAPAEAARLSTWRFNSQENRLVFTTDDGVQPRAQLVPNPTRVVIDLPGITGTTPANQSIGGAIREVRVGQFDPQTTRIVIELSPGYTLDPTQVLVRGANPTEWSVQLPTPQRVSGGIPPEPSTRPTPQTSPRPGAIAQLEEIQSTTGGFFVRTTGTPGDIDLDRAGSRRRRRIELELENTVLSPRLTQRELTVNRLGVRTIRLEQAETSPPVARVTLELEQDADWQAVPSPLGGVVLLPGRSTSTTGVVTPPSPSATPTPTPGQQQIATVQSVNLVNDRTLQIQASQPITFSATSTSSPNIYNLVIPNARLSPQVVGPSLTSRSSLRQVRLRQDGNNVVLLIEAAPGVQLGNTNQRLAQVLSIPLIVSNQRPGTVTLPEGPRNGRVIVVIDPGHGGMDPGAVGIRGLREVDVVLPISLEVASLLQQQGINVVMTRTEDRTVELETRVDIAERANGTIFLSIHANSISLSRPEVNGVETYHYSTAGQPLAAAIQRSILDATGMNDRGVKQARFYVLRNTSMPSALVEVGFVTGANDAPRLSDPAFRSVLARAITRGILNYFQGRY